MRCWRGRPRASLELADGPTDGYVVKVRPEQVVEIALDGVQTSSRYPGGMALRFARVLRYRDDKSPAEADTIDTVRALYQRGGNSSKATTRVVPPPARPLVHGQSASGRTRTGIVGR